MDVFRRYRFCIAIENTVAHDYITEKLWDAFAAGCVPVYYVRRPTASQRPLYGLLSPHACVAWLAWA